MSAFIIKNLYMWIKVFLNFDRWGYGRYGSNVACCELPNIEQLQQNTEKIFKTVNFTKYETVMVSILSS